MPKSTYYHYKKTRPHQGEKSIPIKSDESEEAWVVRLKAGGLTNTQITAIKKVDSLEAFVNYCKEQGLESAGIPASRLKRMAE